jgi:hypothetical protein
MLADLEPFATIAEVQALLQNTQDELEGYNWDNDEVSSVLYTNQDASDDVEEMILPYTSNNSPWKGGPVINFNDSYSFDTDCDNALTATIGPYAAGGVCWVSAIAKDSGLSLWIQLIAIDIPAAIWLLSFFWNIFVNTYKVLAD